MFVKLLELLQNRILRDIAFTTIHEFESAIKDSQTIAQSDAEYQINVDLRKHNKAIKKIPQVDLYEHRLKELYEEWPKLSKAGHKH